VAGSRACLTCDAQRRLAPSLLLHLAAVRRLGRVIEARAHVSVGLEAVELLAKGEGAATFGSERGSREDGGQGKGCAAGRYMHAASASSVP